MLQALPEIKTPLAGITIFILIILGAAFFGFIKNDDFKERLYTLLFLILLPLFCSGFVFFAFADSFFKNDNSLIDRFQEGNHSNFNTIRKDLTFNNENEPMILDGSYFQNCEFKNMKLRFMGQNASIHFGSKFSNVTMNLEATERVSILMQPQQAVGNTAK